MSKVQALTRWLLGAGLLWVAWHHVHWSVALCLTLMFIAFEIMGWIILSAIKGADETVVGKILKEQAVSGGSAQFLEPKSFSEKFDEAKTVDDILK